MSQNPTQSPLDEKALQAAVDAADAASPIGRAYSPGILAAITAYLSALREAPAPSEDLVARRKTNETALLVAAKKLRSLRIETIGGDKSRPARTVGSIIDREGDLKGDVEFVAWVIKNALRYYEDAAK